VSYGDKERFLGEAASSHVRTNMFNTVTHVKRLAGLKFADPAVTYERDNFVNTRMAEAADGEIGLQVSYAGEDFELSPQQALGAFFTKCKDVVRSAHPAAAVPDAVISVPSFFTDAQRQAVRDAAAIGGLNCLRVLNEGTAIALSYGMFKSAKKEFPEGKETKVMFLDMGYAHFTATVAAFTNTGLRILASASDATNGGRELDVAIAKAIAADFKAKFNGEDPWANRKARLKLLVAADKAKTAVTPYGVNNAPINIECLMNDRDYSSNFTSEQLDALAAPFMARMQACITRALAHAGVSLDAPTADLAAVELVGGGMRPRVVKRAAAQVLKLPMNEETGHGLGTSMNLDEAVSRGCALACAMLSPLIRIIPYEVADIVPYPIRVKWEAPADAHAHAANDADAEEEANAAATASSGSTVLFKAREASPLTRRITFRRAADFEVVAEYDASADPQELGDPLPFSAQQPASLGKFTIAGVAAAAASGSEDANVVPRIRVDFKHDMNGIITLVKAEMLKEIKETPPPAPPAKEGGEAPMDEAAAAAAAPAPVEEKAAKKRFKRTDLQVVRSGGATLGMSSATLQQCVATEARMAKQDADVRATQDMRNSLETYIYAARSSLEGEWAPYATAEAKEAMSSALAAMEDWLYNDGFEADKVTYEAKLNELKAAGEPIARRKAEAESRKASGDSLLQAVENFRGIINNRDGKHGHLSDSDRDVLRAACHEAEDWYRTKQDEQSRLPLTADPVLKVADIQSRKEQLVKELMPIANRPVPAPAPAPVPAPAPAQAPMDESPAASPAAEGAEPAPMEAA
jgi:heat shock protein 4